MPFTRCRATWGVSPTDTDGFLPPHNCLGCAIPGNGALRKLLREVAEALSQLFHAVGTLTAVAQQGADVYPIAVAPTLFLPRDDVVLFQSPEDGDGGPLRDAGGVGDLAQG